MIARFSRRTLALVGLTIALAGLVAPALAQWGTGRGPSQSSARMAIEFLDVGQGDSILIRSPEGKTALVDAGPSRDAAAEWLRRKGIDRVDLVVATHHHSDHIGGMEAVVRDFQPRYFLFADGGHATQGWLRLLKLVKDEGVAPVVAAGKPRRIELGSVTLTVFPQPPEDAKNENNNSVGLRVQYGGFSVILTGDSEEAERRWWLANCSDLVRDGSVLKLAHHGSHNGIDADWLEMVRPDLAVASLGRGNSYGHPHREALDLLRDYQVPLMRTDDWGTITLVSDGETWHLVTLAPLARRRAAAREPSNVAGSREGAPARRR